MSLLVGVTVLARAPEPGRVKTRLAGVLGPEGACSLHEALSLDVLEALDRWRRHARTPVGGVVLSLAGSRVAGRRLSDPAARLWGIRCERQPRGGLGRRIEAAAVRRLEEGHSAALVLGSDAPLLPSGLLDRACAALRSAEAVLVPASDGGFVALAVRRLPEGCLAGVDWGTAVVFGQVRERLARCGLRVAAIGAGRDVDDLDSLQRLARRLRRRPVLAPRTWSWLVERARRGEGPAVE